jgi:hypothetical protein
MSATITVKTYVPSFLIGRFPHDFVGCCVCITMCWISTYERSKANAIRFAVFALARGTEAGAWKQVESG